MVENIKFKKKIKSKKILRFKQLSKADLKKGLKVLPHIFTLGNAFFGFYSVIFAARKDWIAASYFILLAALLDALDGRIARAVGATTLIGVELDSLSDVISFCFAPALLMYFWKFKVFGFFGVLICALFLLAGIWRLARFNISHDEQTVFFLGLPTTIAGCFLAIIVLNSKNLFFVNSLCFTTFLMCLILLFAFLMVSHIHFPTFKQKFMYLTKHRKSLIFIVLFAVLSIFGFHFVLLLLFLSYFIFSFLNTYKWHTRKSIYKN